MGRYKDFDREPRRGGYDRDQESEDRAFGRRPDLQPTQSRSSADQRSVAPSRVTGEVNESFGTVKLYKADKGFGFVGQDGGGKDVFVHATALARAGLSGLTEGQRVRMQIGQGQKGLEARTIELLD
jgi:cold shock CspA family protein